MAIYVKPEGTADFGNGDYGLVPDQSGMCSLELAVLYDPADV